MHEIFLCLFTTIFESMKTLELPFRQEAQTLRRPLRLLQGRNRERTKATTTERICQQFTGPHQSYFTITTTGAALLPPWPETVYVYGPSFYSKQIQTARAWIHWKQNGTLILSIKGINICWGRHHWRRRDHLWEGNLHGVSISTENINYFWYLYGILADLRISP